MPSGRGIDFHEFGTKNGTDFYHIGIRQHGIDFRVQRVYLKTLMALARPRSGCALSLSRTSSEPAHEITLSGDLNSHFPALLSQSRENLACVQTKAKR